MVKRGDVLVVDDDPSITEWLHRKLSAKYEVRQAHSVADALLAVGLRAPDALVTDLGMDDVGGEHLLAFVASAFPEVRRVVYSATSHHRLGWTVDSGLPHVAINKAGDVVELAEALDRLLASTELADQAGVSTSGVTP